MLQVQELTVKYGANTIVDNISFTLEDNKWLMLVGPNGAGKSTIISAISGGVPSTGKVLYQTQNVKKMSSVQKALNIGIMTQYQNVTYSFTVWEVVKLGRYAYSNGIFASHSDEDEEKINRALELTGMLPYADQNVLTLSGGERQRTFLAQIFAQDPKLLVLDEPTNHLDLIYQKQIFELIGEWVKQPGRAVISVVHDLNLVRSYGTDALLLDKGKAIGFGSVRSVLSRENLKKVYQMDVFDWMHTMLSQW